MLSGGLPECPSFRHERINQLGVRFWFDVLVVVGGSVQFVWTVMRLEATSLLTTPENESKKGKQQQNRSSGDYPTNFSAI